MGEARIEMGKMLDAGSEGMNPFRLLYNLEVLSGRLNVHSSPSSIEQSDKFVTDFLDSGGLGLVFKTLEQGGDSIGILDGFNPSLNPSLNHFSIQCLPKRVLNLVLNPSLNPSLKF